MDPLAHPRRRPQPLARLAVVLLLAGATHAPSSGAATAAPAAGPLADRSLEELMGVEVVSASRRRVALNDTPAAVTVITHEDIVRSGARVLPEVLRLAPGVDVARISSGRWAVGVRGDTSRFSGGLQVLLDGRSIYSPYFSGVFWDVEQVPLADIERIEIIRGPAGATWGSNAVNGVINIITFSARDTVGTLVDGSVASDGMRRLHLRHGAVTEDGEGAWRVSARTSGTSSYTTPTGRDAHDENHNTSLTGRLDRRLDRGDLSLQLQALQASDNDEWILPTDRPPLFSAPTRVELRFRRLLASGLVTQRLSDDGLLQASASLAHEEADLVRLVKTGSTTADVEVQHQFSTSGGTQGWTYGAGLRAFDDHTEAGDYGGLDPASRRWLQWRVFAQDRITLLPNRLWFGASMLVDRNPYTGVQLQPGIDLSWRLSPTQSFWASLARSSEVPGRGFQDAEFSLVRQPVPLPGRTQPVPVEIAARPGQPLSTSVTALQIGSRSRFGQTLSLDLTGFVQRYRDLGRFMLPDPAAVVRGALTGQPVDVAWLGTNAHTAGVEAALDWRVRPGLRSQFALSTLHVTGDDRANLNASTLARSPRGLASWRLSWDVAPHVFLDGWLRYTARRPAFLSGEAPVPAHTALDLSLRWRVSPTLTLSLAGYNLGQRRVLEASNFNTIRLTTPVLVERAVALRATVAF